MYRVAPWISMGRRDVSYVQAESKKLREQALAATSVKPKQWKPWGEVNPGLGDAISLELRTPPTLTLARNSGNANLHFLILYNISLSEKCSSFCCKVSEPWSRV